MPAFILPVLCSFTPSSFLPPFLSYFFLLYLPPFFFPFPLDFFSFSPFLLLSLFPLPVLPNVHAHLTRRHCYWAPVAVRYYISNILTKRNPYQILCPSFLSNKKRTQTHTHTQTHKHTHIHIHTHTHAQHTNTHTHTHCSNTVIYVQTRNLIISV